jgi:hypothetical protein
MQRVHQAAGIAFAALGVFMALQGRALGIEGMYGPGRGFFAFVVGVALCITSVLWLARVTVHGAEKMPADFVPERDGLVRIAAIVCGLAAFAVAVTSLGFNLTMLAFLLILFFAAGGDHPIAKVITAIAASFGLNYVFEELLKVPLPDASLPALRALGL